MSARTPPTDATLAEAVAWHRGGRKATGAHPLCVCLQPVNYPPRPELTPLNDPGYLACETCDERRDWLAADRERRRAEYRRWRDECEATRLAARCPIHGLVPSRWSMPR